jgi:hypothetical protein
MWKSKEEKECDLTISNLQYSIKDLAYQINTEFGYMRNHNCTCGGHFWKPWSSISSDLNFRCDHCHLPWELSTSCTCKTEYRIWNKMKEDLQLHLKMKRYYVKRRHNRIWVVITASVVLGGLTLWFLV